MKEIFEYRALLVELVKRDIKKKYRRSVLGILWSMLNPFLTMLIMAMVFSTFFKFAIANFPVYLLTGQLIFNFYSEATGTAMGSILENAALIKKVYVPKHIFPIARVLSSCVNFILSLPGLILVIVITKAPIKISVLFSIIPVLYVLFFCFGIGLLLASVTVYFRDMFHLYGVLLTAISYLTPLFYPKEIVPEKYMFLIRMNPMVYFVDLFRDMVYYGKMPTLDEHLNCIFIIIISLFAGVVVFNMNKKKFILHI
jgi:ABC-2 type transporter